MGNDHSTFPQSRRTLPDAVTHSPQRHATARELEHFTDDDGSQHWRELLHFSDGTTLTIATGAIAYSKGARAFALFGGVLR